MDKVSVLKDPESLQERTGVQGCEQTLHVYTGAPSLKRSPGHRSHACPVSLCSPSAAWPRPTGRGVAPALPVTAPSVQGPDSNGGAPSARLPSTDTRAWLRRLISSGLDGGTAVKRFLFKANPQERSVLLQTSLRTFTDVCSRNM